MNSRINVEWFLRTLPSPSLKKWKHLLVSKKILQSRNRVAFGSPCQTNRRANCQSLGHRFYSKFFVAFRRENCSFGGKRYSYQMPTSQYRSVLMIERVYSILFEVWSLTGHYWKGVRSQITRWCAVLSSVASHLTDELWYWIKKWGDIR